MPIERGADGYHHPATVEELRELVEHAYQSDTKLRVRGAAHSVDGAIFNDGFDGDGAPPVGSIEVMLDKFIGVTITPEDEPSHAIAEVEAGCHLGKMVYDPTRTSTWKNGLNYQLQQAGYAFDDLGGISHQTVSGFMLTGSAGGSIRHTLVDDIMRFQIIDGTGTLHDLRRDDPDPDKRDMFFAAGVSMGLLGVVAKVWFRVRRSYNVAGQEVSTRFADCAVDLLGDGAAGKPSLEQYLRDAPYARILWWPQHDFDRVQLWECGRLEPTDAFEPQPFQILTRVESLAGSLIMTIVGNAEDLTVVPGKLGKWYEHLERTIEGDPDDNVCVAAEAGGPVAIEEVLSSVQARLKRAVAKHPKLAAGIEAEDEDVKKVLDEHDTTVDDHDDWNDWLAGALTRVIRMALDGTLDSWLGKLMGRLLKRYLAGSIDELLGLFVEAGTKKFSDVWMCGLPMDNQMDDELWPTEFTELWIPIEKTQQVMLKLRDYYAANGDPDEAYRRTRAYACELYAAAKSEFWMSASYGAHCFRVDPFWFSTWAGSSSAFFEGVWEVLKEFGFRPHWGKHLPPPSDRWRAHYRAQLPKLDDFLTLREQLDPKQIFVTSYWRDHLGIAPPAG